MKKKLCHLLTFLWASTSIVNLFAFIGTLDTDKLIIAMLEGLLAWANYEDCKRRGA